MLKNGVNESTFFKERILGTQACRYKVIYGGVSGTTFEPTGGQPQSTSTSQLDKNRELDRFQNIDAKKKFDIISSRFLHLLKFALSHEETSMPVVISFDSEEDHERALDILFDLEATYSGVRRGHILVSAMAARTLQERGVRCQIVSGRLEEEPQ